MTKPVPIVRNIALLAFVFLIGYPISANAQKMKLSSIHYLDFCSLYQDQNLNKTFKSRALMFYSTIGRVDGDDSFLYSPDCNSGDYFAVYGDGSKGWKTWDSFFRNLEKKQKHYVLEVEFEGRMVLANDYLFGHLGWARAALTTSRITSVKDVTDTGRGIQHKYKSPTPLTHQVEQLGFDCYEFLRSLYTLTEPKQFEALLLPTFVFVDEAGQSLSKSEYLARERHQIELRTAKTLSSGRKFVKRSGNTLTELGTIKITDEDGSTRTFSCEMAFQLVNDEWKLSQARMK